MFFSSSASTAADFAFISSTSAFCASHSFLLSSHSFLLASHSFLLASHSFLLSSTALRSASSSFFSVSFSLSTSFSDSRDARRLSSSVWLFFRFSTDSCKHVSFSAIVDFIVSTRECRLFTSSTCWRSCSISAFRDAFSSFSWVMMDSLSSMSWRSFVA